MASWFHPVWENRFVHCVLSNAQNFIWKISIILKIGMKIIWINCHLIHTLNHDPLYSRVIHSKAPYGGEHTQQGSTFPHLGGHLWADCVQNTRRVLRCPAWYRVLVGEYITFITNGPVRREPLSLPHFFAQNRCRKETQFLNLWYSSIHPAKHLRLPDRNKLLEDLTWALL